MTAPLQQPTFLVLTALAAQPRHGYGILQEVPRLSQGRIQLGTGTLYGALERLADQGLVVADRDEVVDGRLRRYHRLTDEGARTLEREIAWLRHDSAAAAAVAGYATNWHLTGWRSWLDASDLVTTLALVPVLAGARRELAAATHHATARSTVLALACAAGTGYLLLGPVVCRPLCLP